MHIIAVRSASSDELTSNIVSWSEFILILHPEDTEAAVELFSLSNFPLV